MSGPNLKILMSYNLSILSLMWWVSRLADRLCGFRDAQAMLLCNLISLTVGRGCDLLLVMKYMSKVCDKMCVIMWMIQYVMCIENYDACLTRTFFTLLASVEPAPMVWAVCMESCVSGSWVWLLLEKPEAGMAQTPVRSWILVTFNHRSLGKLSFLGQPQMSF